MPDKRRALLHKKGEHQSRFVFRLRAIAEVVYRGHFHDRDEFCGGHPVVGFELGAFARNSLHLAILGAVNRGGTGGGLFLTQVAADGICDGC